MKFSKKESFLGKSLLLILSLALVFSLGIIAGCGGDDDDDDTPQPAFSTASLIGVWILDTSGIGETNEYFVYDGHGDIISHSVFFGTSKGVYSVESNGSFTLTLQNSTPDTLILSGTLSSATAGTVDTVIGLAPPGSFNFPLEKVPDISALNGTLSGTLTETCASGDTMIYPKICDGTVYDVAGLIVNSTGIVTGGTITNTTGAPYEIFNVAYGGAYAKGGDVVISLHTDAGIADYKPYGLMRITGTITGSYFTGVYKLDSDVDGLVGIGSLTLAP